MTLKADGTLKLDTVGATVRLDTSNSTVRLVSSGVSSLTRPTPQQLQGDNRPPSNAKPVTNYTIFKKVEFGKGAVWTGWEFQSNEDAAPYQQGCYYMEGGDNDFNASIKYDIGWNYAMTPPKRDLPIDVAQAFQSCVWFR